MTLLAAVAVASPSAALAQHTGCRSSDSETTRIVQYVRDIVTEPDELTDSLGLAGQDTLSIVSESDSTACVRVAQVVDSVFAAELASPYVVVRAGSLYFAYAPSTDPDNPNRLIHVVSNAFVYRETIVAF